MVTKNKSTKIGLAWLILSILVMAIACMVLVNNLKSGVEQQMKEDANVSIQEDTNVSLVLNESKEQVINLTAELNESNTELNTSFNTSE